MTSTLLQQVQQLRSVMPHPEQWNGMIKMEKYIAFKNLILTEKYCDAYDPIDIADQKCEMFDVDWVSMQKIFDRSERVAEKLISFL